MPKLKILQARFSAKGIGHTSGNYITSYKSLGLLKDHVGEKIRVYGPKLKATGIWNCKAKWVWQIHQVDVERLTGNEVAHAYCCEHQIEIIKKRK